MLGQRFHCSSARALRSPTLPVGSRVRLFASCTFRFRQSKAPLRILFCGSDQFSVVSLQALHQYAQENPAHIASIEVVSKKDKFTGRGLKKLTPPPIKHVAADLGLPLHQIDTFTSWGPPGFFSNDGHDQNSINLIIAVSFGLLVPPRILQSSKYGGLNVHPSLLPDLRGAAPIHWAILKGYRRTGVSIQTLHPSNFDGGTILDQREVSVPSPVNCSFEELRDVLAPIGAEMLLKTLQNELYISPQSIPPPPDSHLVKYSLAPKITAQMMQVDFGEHDSGQILRMSRVMPRLWAEVVLNPKKIPDHLHPSQTTRIVFGKTLVTMDPDIKNKIQERIMDLEPGLPCAVIPLSESVTTSMEPLFVRTKDNKILAIYYMTVAGHHSNSGAASAAKAGLFKDPELVNGFQFFTFYEPTIRGNSQAIGGVKSFQHCNQM